MAHRAHGGQQDHKTTASGGFAAESAGAVTIFFSSVLGVPVSTTHTITGAIIGVGSARRLRAVRWGVASNILWSWILTIPLSAAMAAITYVLITLTQRLLG
jgi:PiT family inorganic phosphate transporter